MAKNKSVKKVKHQSFKVTPPKPPQEKIFFYTVVSAFAGIIIGWYFGNQVITTLATYTP